MTATPHANPIDLSVIVPSYNRRTALAELLHAIEKQTLPPDRYEIIIVLDGSTDGSAKLLETWACDHPAVRLRIIRQCNRGQSAARSHGAAQATASRLLFLDDDIVPEPNCLMTHVQRHRQTDRPVAVLGDARVPQRNHESYYDLVTRMWWGEMYDDRSQRFPYVIYRDFCSSHVSLSRDLFESIGGFDPAFEGYGGEDYDLGYRLLKADIPFVLAPEARVHHHHRGSPRQVYRNLLDEGRNDVWLATKHPELRSSLRCATPGPTARVIFLMPLLFHIALKVGAIVLDFTERGRLWYAWRWLFGKLRFVAYWLGVRRAFGHWKEYRQYLQNTPSAPTVTLDITDGLPADVSTIWRQGESDVKLRIHGEDKLIHLDFPPTGHFPGYVVNAILYSF